MCFKNYNVYFKFSKKKNIYRLQIIKTFGDCGFAYWNDAMIINK